LDFLALSYIDPSGVTALKLLNEAFSNIDIIIYLAGISGIYTYIISESEPMELSQFGEIKCVCNQDTGSHSSLTQSETKP
jgi:hypothetical protein